jgi:hypothetical protein
MAKASPPLQEISIPEIQSIYSSTFPLFEIHFFVYAVIDGLVKSQKTTFYEAIIIRYFTFYLFISSIFVPDF